MKNVKNKLKLFISFSSLYQSSEYYGSRVIFNKYLGFNKNYPFPITIPHGVDFYHAEKHIDIDSIEPIYGCFRNDIFNDAKKIKPSIKLPHPWLIFIKNKKIKKGKGTLFVAPPSSTFHNNQLFSTIQNGNYSKPWAILLKERSNLRFEKFFWNKMNIKTFTAGKMHDEKFYYNLFNILNKYEYIVVANMTSAAIFAGSIKKKIRIIPKFTTRIIETHESGYPKKNSKKYRLVQNVWKNLASKNIDRSCAQSNYLLGVNYLNKERLLDDLNLLLKSIIKKNYFFFLGSRNYWLLKFYKYIFLMGIPLLKYHNNFIKRLMAKFQKFFLRRKLVSINDISEFSYFQVFSKFIPFKKYNLNYKELVYHEPGQALERK